MLKIIIKEMDKKIIIGVVIAVVLIIGIGAFIYIQQSASPKLDVQPPVSDASQTNTVEIANFAFSPAELTIKTGDTVTWTNKDSAQHKIASDLVSEINSDSLSTGQTYSHTFNTAGTFDYHCSIHPSMKAKIIVQ